MNAARSLLKLSCINTAESPVHAVAPCYACICCAKISLSSPIHVLVILNTLGCSETPTQSFTFPDTREGGV